MLSTVDQEIFTLKIIRVKKFRVVKFVVKFVVKCVLCVCKPGFAKLTVDYSEDQRSQKIVLPAINNAFGVQSDHVQDIAVS